MLAGNPDKWRPHFRGLEELLASAVEAAWPACIEPLRSEENAMSRENHITEHLVQSLIRKKSFPGRIVYQYPLLAEDD